MFIELYTYDLCLFQSIYSTIIQSFKNMSQQVFKFAKMFVSFFFFLFKLVVKCLTFLFRHLIEA